MIRVTFPSLPSAAELAPAIDSIARSGQGSNHGPFEQMLRNLALTLLGTSVATAANATIGLELALRRVLRGVAHAYVLVPAFTFPATAHAIMNAGSMPVFCDVDDETWMLPRVIEGKGLPIIDAIVPVCSLGAALPDEWCSPGVAPVVVDAAAALDRHFPSEWHAASVFSLHATKPIAAGEGALIAVQSPDEAKAIRDMATFGFMEQDGIALTAGSNAKLTEYGAAIALASWVSWPARRTRLLAIHALYRELLGDAVRWQKADAPSYAALGVRVPDAERMQRALAEEEIETRRWYWPALHQHPAFRGCPVIGRLPVTEALGRELIGLPFHARLSDEDVKTVCHAVLRELGK